jgi:hypothetical protein
MSDEIKSFRDDRGFEWHPKITFLTFDLFERETGESLFSVAGELQKCRRVRPMLVIAFYACRAEVKERGISYDDFAEGFSTIELSDGMLSAVGVAIQRFFQSQPNKTAL